MDVLDLKLNHYLWSKLSKELEDFIGSPLKDIEEAYGTYLRQEQPLESTLYKTQNPDDVYRYYKSTSRYLYELIRWEATLEKQNNFRRIYLFLKKHRINSIIDFGGGVGGLCLYLNGCKIKCDYLDIYGKTFEFAKWRFELRNNKIKMFDFSKEWPCSKYQALIAYDVLEHLPNLEETINKIGTILEDNGFFLSKSTFSGGGLHLKKNEIYSEIKKFNELLVSNRLKYYGRLKNSFLSEFLNSIGINAVTGIRISKKLKYGGNILVYRKV